MKIFNFEISVSDRLIDFIVNPRTVSAKLIRCRSLVYSNDAY